MLASHRLQHCRWRERGWLSRTSTALPLPSQYSESCMDRHAFATACILSTILSLGLFLGGGPLQCILKHFGNWMRRSETNLSDLVLWIYSMLSRYKIMWFIIKACSTFQLSQVKKKKVKNIIMMQLPKCSGAKALGLNCMLPRNNSCF